MQANPRRHEDCERAPSRTLGRSPVAHLSSFERWMSSAMLRGGLESVAPVPSNGRPWFVRDDREMEKLLYQRWLYAHREEVA